MKLTKTQERMIALLKSGVTKGYNLNSLDALIRKGIVIQGVYYGDTQEEARQHLIDDGYIIEYFYKGAYKLAEKAIEEK